MVSITLRSIVSVFLVLVCVESNVIQKRTFERNDAQASFRSLRQSDEEDILYYLGYAVSDMSNTVSDLTVEIEDALFVISAELDLRELRTLLRTIGQGVNSLKKRSSGASTSGANAIQQLITAKSHVKNLQDLQSYIADLPVITALVELQVKLNGTRVKLESATNITESIQRHIQNIVDDIQKVLFELHLAINSLGLNITESVEIINNGLVTALAFVGQAGNGKTNQLSTATLKDAFNLVISVSKAMNIISETNTNLILRLGQISDSALFLGYVAAGDLGSSLQYALADCVSSSDSTTATPS